MVRVRFATVEDAGAISNICSEAWRITYVELYSKEYIEKLIADFYNIDRIKKECQESSNLEFPQNDSHLQIFKALLSTKLTK